MEKVKVGAATAGFPHAGLFNRHECGRQAEFYDGGLVGHRLQ